ncbi:tyrosine-type recombinase/integrase [Sinimarinibacterium flocculans]|uniref:Integrase n=3 Tax=Sinimarinibacterium flocculans TaxID=985250 RepID=A0A318EIS4_9GAMM|nr:integrase [Sinimarinibacterium flocculans]
MVAMLKVTEPGMAANDTASGEVTRLSVPITPALIKQLARQGASESDRYIQDSEVSGFKLLRRRGPGRPRLVFQFIGRVKGAGKVLKVTIGPAYGRGAVTLAKARAEALRHSEACREGRNRVAEQKERNAAVAAAAHQSGNRAQWTIQYAFDDLLRYRHELGQTVEKMKLRPATQVVYARCIRNTGALAKRPVMDVTKAEIHDALMRIPTMAERAKVRRVLSLTIGHAFDRLNIEDKANPVSKLARGVFAAPKARETYLSESKVGPWVLAVRGVTNARDERLAFTAGNLALTLLLFGMRYNEAAMMEWGWFDDDESAFTIPAAIVKTKEPRTLPVTPWFARILTVQRETCARLQEQRGVYPRHVFPGRGQGERMKDIRAVMDAAGCQTHFPKPQAGGAPSFRPHDLRRTFATHFAAQVSDGSRLKWILGHTAKDITERYIRPEPEQMRRDLERYQGWLEMQAAWASDATAQQYAAEDAERARRNEAGYPWPVPGAAQA